MRTNALGLALIKEFEGCKLESYPDPATGGSPWTVGYGSTLGVTPCLKITQEDAERRLAADVERIEMELREFNPDLNTNQYSALICFAFNIKHWQDTPLFECIIRREMLGAANHWLRYCKAAGKVMPGLLRRREAELALFKLLPSQV